MSRKQMALGAFLTATGQHVAAWRHPSVRADGGVNLEEYVRIVRIAEQAKFDMMFLADSTAAYAEDVASEGLSCRVSNFEPLTLLSALASVTSRIGLVATATTTFNEPYNIARKFASLDMLSGGRAGWNLVTSSNRAEAKNFGLDEHVAHGDRYERAEEFARIVLGLWDSWEDDAFLFDKATCQFFDPSKMHVLDHAGKHFKVLGPLNISRSPQGRPILVQAGSSQPGKELAAWSADVVFTAQVNKADAAAFYSDIKSLVAKSGRHPDTVKVMPGLTPVVAETEDEAKRKFDALQQLIHPKVGLNMLKSLTYIDYSKYPLDGPFPDFPDDFKRSSRAELIRDNAIRENLTIRQTYMRVAGNRGHNLVIGTPSRIADVMEEWFRDGAADGFNIMPVMLPDSLQDFADLAVPELRRRGLFREDYAGTTLREHLGLPWPAHGDRSRPQPLNASLA